MTMFARLVVILSLAVLPGLAQASDPQEISWDMLAPPVDAIDNPFENLTDDQMDTLRQILRFEAQAKRGDVAEARAKADALRKDLAEQGLDVDGLFAARVEIMEKREAAASAVNEALIGSSVRIPGHVLPLEFKDRKAVEFLLCRRSAPASTLRRRPPTRSSTSCIRRGSKSTDFSPPCGSPGPWSPRVRFRMSGMSTDRPRCP